MSKPKSPVVPRPARLRAQAPALLLGDRSRVARLAAEDAPDEGGSAAPDRVAELWLYGVVGGYWSGFNADSVSRALRSLGDIDELVVRIHSPGGLASDGVAIGNLLRNFDATITVVVDGLAASAASVIAVAGDHVVMCPGSQLMLHDASTFEYGNAGDHRKIADWLDGQSQNYAGVYTYKAGGTPEQWREVMLANDGWGTWYTAEAAVTANLADEIGTRVARTSPPTAPDDDFEDDDAWAKAAHDLQILEQHVPAAARALWAGERPKPPSASAVGSTHTEGGSAVSLSDQAVTTLRTKLGIAEDADEATILAALDEALDERAEPQAATNVPDGHVVIPAVQLQELKDGAAAGVRAAQTLHERDREAFLDSNKAKFAAKNRAAWAKEYDRDPEGTRQHFAEAPDIIPAELLGHEAEGVDREDGATATAATEQPGYKNWRF